MQDEFTNSMEPVFATLPEGKASQALGNLAANTGILKQRLKWVDVDQQGHFMIGGSTDIAGYSVEIFSSASEDKEIVRLVEKAEPRCIRSGLIEHCIGENSIFWFLPVLFETKEGQSSGGIRALTISEPLVHNILQLFNDGLRITTAERHLAFQLIAGLSLRDAAEADNLAFETKRTQLKNMCSKLQCGGQTDLIRQLLGQMSFLLSVCEVSKCRSGRLGADLF